MIKVLILMLLGQVNISDQLPMPVTYPDICYQMSDQEFYEWATDFNQSQRKSLSKSDELKWLIGDGIRFREDAIESYSKFWVNPEYSGPGPLMIVNPFCKPESK